MPNVLVISGRLGRPREGQSSPIGEVANAGQSNARVNFSIAINDGYGDNRKTIWQDVTVFGKHAETVAGYGLEQGQEVTVTGRMTLRDTGYVKGSNGQEYERPIVGIVANFVEPGRKKGEGGPSNGGGQAPASTQAAAESIPEW